jgi:hypothetical protein
MKPQQVVPILSKWYPQLGKSRAALLDSLAGPDLKESPKIGFGSWAGLTRIHNRSVDIASYYLENDRVVLIYIANIAFCQQLKLSNFLDVLGPPLPHQLMPARTDRHAMLHVYAHDGIAISVNGQAIEAIELFVPMTLEEYVRKIYKKPAAMGL